MKFIFPQNYNLKSKILGFIDYQSAILDGIWMCIVFVFINFLFNSLYIKVSLFIILVLPVVILSLVGINGENVIYVMTYIFKYLVRQKVILYKKY